MRGSSGSIRVIAGRWRGTRIAVADLEALRPTPDRVRETLFNWLAPELPGARCLDLFAGTGILGFEAVSRGAARCDLVERDAVLVANMTALRQRLDADTISLHRADARQWLAQPPRLYDLVFIDPPFHAGLVAGVLDRITQGWLAPQGLVYVECEREATFEHAALTPHRAGTTQHIRYTLLRYTG